MTIPKFRAWWEKGKRMLDIAAIDFLEKEVKSHANVMYRFDDIELMQSTGLVDKNGKEIFESDIVKIPDDYSAFGKNAGEILKVAFNNGCFRLKRPNSKGRGFYFEDDSTVTIIGNIYENPEFLEEVK